MKAASSATILGLTEALEKRLPGYRFRAAWFVAEVAVSRGS